ncbi:hypothetical protein LOD99_12002 [Oopsacas minuta]|uniref:Uncharacterized protein n=1 Tax=Oopsacas minuta TaxID=111878 RepID=A0AAV7JH43_9METZ|nr:hypothetical protein LOD99_12002 [Oopsacas minuta]
MSTNIFHLKLALFKTHSCKGTSKLNRETDLITPWHQHNHGIEDSVAWVGILHKQSFYIDSQEPRSISSILRKNRYEIASFLSQCRTENLQPGIRLRL